MKKRRSKKRREKRNEKKRRSEVEMKKRWRGRAGGAMTALVGLPFTGIM